MANEKSNPKPAEKTRQTTLPSPFDKFIEDQLKREQKNIERHKTIADHGETPQQKYNKLYRENPGNKTVWRKK